MLIKLRIHLSCFIFKGMRIDVESYLIYFQVWGHFCLWHPGHYTSVFLINTLHFWALLYILNVVFLAIITAKLAHFKQNPDLEPSLWHCVLNQEPGAFCSCLPVNQLSLLEQVRWLFEWWWKIIHVAKGLCDPGLPTAIKRDNVSEIIPCQSSKNKL